MWINPHYKYSQDSASFAHSTIFLTLASLLIIVSIGNMSKVLEVTPPIRCSPDKFYDFFKNHMSDLLTVFPASFNSVQVLEGENGKVGCVKVWNFVAGKNKIIE